MWASSPSQAHESFQAHIGTRGRQCLLNFMCLLSSGSGYQTWDIKFLVDEFCSWPQGEVLGQFPASYALWFVNAQRSCPSQCLLFCTFSHPWLWQIEVSFPNLQIFHDLGPLAQLLTILSHDGSALCLPSHKTISLQHWIIFWKNRFLTKACTWIWSLWGVPTCPECKTACLLSGLPFGTGFCIYSLW